MIALGAIFSNLTLIATFFNSLSFVKAFFYRLVMPPIWAFILAPQEKLISSHLHLPNLLVTKVVCKRCASVWIELMWFIQLRCIYDSVYLH